MHDAHCMLHAKVELRQNSGEREILELISEPSGKIFCVDGGVGEGVRPVDMKDMKCQSDP